MRDEQFQIDADIAAINRIDAVPKMLRVICSTTGMGFAAVARVSDISWTACAVQDNIGFGLKPGGQLGLKTTLCFESREERRPIVIDHASLDANYCGHHTPAMYNIESYISVPIVLSDGVYFGNLCAIDPRPAKLKDNAVTDLFTAFAELIALHLENERQRATAESALLDAHAAADLREQFIAVLGHDLRNPLAAVSAAAALIERATAEPRTRDLANRMSHSVTRMSRLISDVMDLAQAKLGGGLTLRMAPIEDVTPALSRVVGELSIAFPDRAVKTAFSIHQPVLGDLDRIQQLLSNLLANALTHGSSAHPVQVKASTDDDHFVLEVINHGKPIPADALAKVFLPYWRPQASEPSAGLGLGLFISSQIVAAHQGSLHVTSSAEAGTAFKAVFPLR